MVRGLPQILLPHLQKLEPEAVFTGNLPYIQSSRGKGYFVKIGSPSEKDQYIGEAESLNAMHIAAPGLSPRVLAYGNTDGKPYFVSEYKNLGQLTDKAAETLGRRLAKELHMYKSTQGFGFGVPTYCGATRQDNGWFVSWEGCFDALMAGLLSKLGGKFGELRTKGEAVRKEIIPKLLRPLVIQPVLLHGDLWSGNIGVDKSTGEPVIYDPSSFYGHNEADLAIGRMFGGIPKTFITTYHQYFPKTEPVDQYDFRTDLYELYHYLNHTVLFGGSYASGAMGKMDRLLEARSGGKI